MSSIWARLPVIIRAIAGGLVIGLVAANVWPLLLISLGVPLAVVAELAFLAVYIWWASGGGPPVRFRAIRADYFRANSLSGGQWSWGVLAAVAFAGVVHAAIILLFRFEAFPAEVFHRGYDFSFISSRGLQWLACVISALSAGICEETGFRGYMQRPIEKHHGPPIAILISSLLFTLLHLNKSWSLIGMVPIVLGAGLLLGMLARASGTLVFCMLGHWLMDIGLFAYWWTQIAGTFSERPLSETGVDQPFIVECIVFAGGMALFVASLIRLDRLGRGSSAL